jgi:hypothetical protein
MAALLRTLQAHAAEDEPPVIVDAISGASAGSMTGLLTAFALAAGADPIPLMHRAWVETPSLEHLRAHDGSAPLTVDALRATAVDILRTAARTAAPQRRPIALSMAVVALRGLEYDLPRQVGDDIDATTHLLWRDFTITDDFDWSQSEPIDVCFASGANALGFPPYWLPNPQGGIPGVTNLPTDVDGLWYTDGGTLKNEPIGQAINIATPLDAGFDGDRLYLLVHPHPDGVPSKDHDDWAGKQRPSWDQTLMHSAGIVMTQSLYDDMVTIERVNRRIAAMASVGAVLDDILVSLPADQRDAALVRLRAALPQDGAQQVAVPRGDAPQAPASAADVVRSAAGLDDKHAVEVAVVSPLSEARLKGLPVESLLAGEFLAHFGGFLDVHLRESDFVLGYRNMLDWMRIELRDERSIDISPTESGYLAQWDQYPGKWGTASVTSLGWRDDLSLVRLVDHIARVAIQGL